MKVQDVALAANFRVIGGTPYQWSCYPDAQFMDFSDIDGKEVAGCIYSVRNQDVYSVEAHVYETDEKDSVSYRWQDPQWVDACNAEAERRGVDNTVAYDGVHFTEVSETEILDLLSRIVHHTYVHAKKIVKDETIIGMSPQSGWPFPTGPKPGPAKKVADANGTIWQALGQRNIESEPASCSGCNGCCSGCGGDESECGGGCDDCDGNCNDCDNTDRDLTEQEMDELTNDLLGEKTEWEVVLTTKHRLDITARNYEEAVAKARAFKENVKVKEWGDGVFWMDHWISKETVTKRRRH